jgi:hypothetical protein
VIISSFAGGRVVHRSHAPGKGHRVHTHDFGNTQGHLLMVRHPPTGMRAVTYSITVKDVPGKVKDASPRRSTFCATPSDGTSHER